MKIYLINDFEELNRISKLKTLEKHSIFADVNEEFGFIVDKVGDEEIALAFRLYNKDNTNSLATIDKLVEEITDHLFSNIDNKTIWFTDTKSSIRALYKNYDRSYKNLFDVKIYTTLTNNKILEKISSLDNFCDFMTFVESRKKIYDLLRANYIEIKPLQIYDIMMNSIDGYIEMENKGFAFSDTIDKTALNTLTVKNNKLYFTYNLTGTITGRTSSKIHPLSKDVKKSIMPDKDKIFINFDYNAAEARVLAHYSGDEELIDIFKNNDQDLHKINAALIFHKQSEEEITTQERIISKLVFFSIINGVSSKTLIEDLKKFKIEAEKIREIRVALQKIYKKAFEWLIQIQTAALTQKYVTNMFGRTRYFTDEDVKDKDKTRRQASNAMIQSTLSDAKLIAVAEIHKKFPGILAAEFHDAILVELPFDNGVGNKIIQISAIMENLPGVKFNCPMKVNHEVKKHL